MALASRLVTVGIKAPVGIAVARPADGTSPPGGRAHLAYPAHAVLPRVSVRTVTRVTMATGGGVAALGTVITRVVLLTYALTVGANPT